MTEIRPVSRLRVVVLASGTGSNFQALVDAACDQSHGFDVVGLVADQPFAEVVRRAEASAIPAYVVAAGHGELRAVYDARLAELVATLEPDLIVLAGWMRMLTMAFLGRFPQSVINIHPALPGEFPGMHAIERALEASQRLGLRRTGVMVHRVPDEGMDSGPVLATTEVEIRPDDTIESLASRMHRSEHELLVTAVRDVAAGSGLPRA